MTDATLYCANHPDRETSLRCNRCGKPICVRCAVQTPVGYRCRECVRGQQAAFETAGLLRLGAAAVISAVAAGIASALLGALGFWGLLLAPVAGGGIAEAVRWAVRRRRSRRLPRVAAAGAVLGILAVAAISLGPQLAFGGAGLGRLGFALLWPVVQAVLLVGALYARLQGIRL